MNDYPERLTDNPIKLAFVVLVALGAIIGPLLIIHDNLETAKQQKIEEVVQARRSAADGRRVALTAEVQELRKLREWPMTANQSTFPLLWQLLAFVFSTAIKFGAEEFLRRKLKSVAHAKNRIIIR